MTGTKKIKQPVKKEPLKADKFLAAITPVSLTRLSCLLFTGSVSIGCGRLRRGRQESAVIRSGLVVSE